MSWKVTGSEPLRLIDSSDVEPLAADSRLPFRSAGLVASLLAFTASISLAT